MSAHASRFASAPAASVGVRSALLAALVVMVACTGKRKRRSEPEVDRSFGAVEPGTPPPPVPERLIPLMPLPPGMELLAPLGVDQFHRGFELRACTAGDPLAAAELIEKTYQPLGWDLERRQVPGWRGYAVSGTHTTEADLVLIATTRPVSQYSLDCDAAKFQVFVTIRAPTPR